MWILGPCGLRTRGRACTQAEEQARLGSTPKPENHLCGTRGTDQKDTPSSPGSNPKLSGSPGLATVGADRNLTFSQVTCGWGRPVILQENRPICPSLTTARPSLVANFGGHSPQMLGRVSTAGDVNLSLERNQQRIQPRRCHNSDLLSEPITPLRLGPGPSKGQPSPSTPQTHF